MATSHEWAETQPFTAPAGGTTAGTPVYLATQKVVVLPLETKTSGQTFTGKAFGLVKAVAKATGTAWVAGRALSWTSTKFKVCTGAVASQATAYGDATAAATTGDVLLRPVVAGVV